MTQDAFAHEFGVGLKTISRAERGIPISGPSAHAIADALGEEFSTLFVSTAPVAIPAQDPVARIPAVPIPAESGIREFLARHPYLSEHQFVDHFLELHHSPDWRGWRAEEVEVEEVGEYRPPPEFGVFLDRYKPTKINPRFGLCGFGNPPTIDDDEGLMVYLLSGSYHYLYAEAMVYKEQHLEDCRAARQTMEDSFLPISRSPVFHVMACEVVAVTADDFVVLARRRVGTPFYPGTWSASIEEQMAHSYPARNLKDLGLFQEAERGVTEELNVTINREKPTLLLSVGLEWTNFGASFVFLVNINEDFASTKKLWPKAKDANEAIALDAIPASPADLRAALSSSRWIPSDRAQGNPILGPDSVSEADWHGTSRARLEAYLQHQMIHGG
jgi:hypothetical protein